MAGFCIDEVGFTGLDNIVEVVAALTDLLSKVHEHEQTTFKSSNLDWAQVTDEVQFWQLMYEEGLALLDNDERLLLIQVINRCEVWEDLGIELQQGNILAAGEETESESIRFVLTKALSGCALGVISASPPQGMGQVNASIGDQQTQMFHIGLNLELQPFYRFLICFESISRQDFSTWAGLAFERLRFVLDLSTQLNKFRQNFEDIRGAVVQHLAAINDDFVSLLMEGVLPAEVCNRVRANCGVDISPESPQTHGNAAAMRERDVEFDGQTVSCEFHSKLTPTHDRIHFSPSLFGDPDEQFLVVGPFAEHLTT